jgi:Mannosylglycerate hydrolase MGH1-like glycoside hydrolase domain
MVPHIVFNEKEKTYFPAADFYEITRSPYAPNHIGTSGMTQSLMHAIACYYIYPNDTDNQKTKPREFLKQIYPKLKLFHKYLMTDRDPEKSGLVTILHPWESGLDDSPVWDHALSQIKIEHVLKFQRLDVIEVGGAKNTIPTDDMYNKFIYMIELMKQYNYDEKMMYENFPFKIKAII